MTCASQTVIVDVLGSRGLDTAYFDSGLVHIFLHLETTLAPLTLSHTVVHVPVGTWLLILTILDRYKITVADHAFLVRAKIVLFVSVGS